MAIKPDNPIINKADDQLKRSGFAEELAKCILNYEYRESLVLGLYGKWGTGKTSIINMAIEEIENLSQGINDESKPIVMKFNPWNYSGNQQLISQFFNELSNTIKYTNGSETLTKVGEKLELVSKFFTPLSLIPGFGVYTDVIQKMFGSGSEIVKGLGDQKENDLITIKKETNDLLKGQSNKIIIIIDDIDRLNSEEIRQVFQLVKTVGDLNNTIYLLSFDKEVVVKALEKVQEGTGEDYLEKIIQLPFEIPLMSTSDVENIFIDKFNFLIKDLHTDNLDNDYFVSIYFNGIQPNLNSLRDVNRLCNSLSFGFSLLKDEINIVDYLAITTLRIFTPNLYESIKNNKFLFTDASESTYRNHRYDEYKQKYTDIKTQYIDELSFNVDEFLGTLFPKVKSYVNNTHYGEHWVKDWRKQRRICSPDFFDLYFQLTLPSTEISNSFMREAIHSIADITQFHSYFSILLNEGKAGRFLDRILDYKDDINLEYIVNIITVIISNADKLPNENQGLFVIYSDSRVSRVAYQLLTLIPSMEERYRKLVDIFAMVDNNLGIQVRFIGRLGQEQGKYGEPKEAALPEEILIDSSQLDSLEKLMSEKISQYAEQNKLLGIDYFSYILHAWERWNENEGDKIIDFVNKVISTDEGLLQFISEFLYEVRSQGGDSYLVKKSWRLDKESLQKYIDVEEIKDRLNIFKDKIDELSEKQKAAISLTLSFRVEEDEDF